MSVHQTILESGRRWGFHACGAGTAVGLVVVCLLLFHRPIVHRLTEQQAVLNELHQVSLSRTALAAALAENQAACKELRQQIDQVAARIAATADVPAAIESLAGLAGRTEVKLLDLQPLVEQKYPQAGLLPLHCRVETTWEGLCRFLAGIQELNPPIRIERVQLGVLGTDQLGPVAIDLSLVFAPNDSVLGKSLALIRDSRQP